MSNIYLNISYTNYLLQVHCLDCAGYLSDVVDMAASVLPPKRRQLSKGKVSTSGSDDVPYFFKAGNHYLGSLNQFVLFSLA